MEYNDMFNILIIVFNLLITAFSTLRITKKDTSLLKLNYSFEKAKIKVKIFEDIIDKVSKIESISIEYVYTDTFSNNKTVSKKTTHDINSAYIEYKNIFYQYIFIFKKNKKLLIQKQLSETETLINHNRLYMDELNDNGNLCEQTHNELEDEIIILKHNFILSFRDILNNEINHFMNSDLFSD